MRRFFFLSLLFLITHWANTQQNPSQSIKRVQLVVNQNIENVGEIPLPFYDISYHLLKNANVEVVLDKSSDCDAVLEINVQGKPLWGYYRGNFLLFTPFQEEEIPREGVYFEDEDEIETRDYKEIEKMPMPWSPPEVFNPAVNPFEQIDLLYTGAILKGEIILKGKDGKIVREGFQGLIEPDEYLFSRDFDKDPPSTPERAPFLLAFLEDGSFPDKLAKVIGKFFGVKVLIPALGERAWELDEVAKRAIFGFGKGAVEFLTKALNNPDNFVRENAAELLGWLNDKRAIPHLIKALKDSWVRESAARSLGRLKAKEAVNDLVRIALNKEISDYTRKAAIVALGEIGDKKAVQALWELTKDVPDKGAIWDSLYLHALIGLANAKESKAVKYLKEAWRDTRGNERVAFALAKIGTPASETLIELLNDSSVKAENRKYIAYALGKLREPRAVNALISSLREREYDFPKYVEWALVKIGEPSIPPLLNALRGEEPRIKAGAIRLLTYLKRREAMEPIFAIAVDKKEDKEARGEAIRAISKVNPKRAKEVLISLFMNKDEDKDLRREALLAFSEIEDNYPAELYSLVFSEAADEFLREEMVHLFFRKKDRASKESFLQLLRRPEFRKYIKDWHIDIIAERLCDYAPEILLFLAKNNPSLQRHCALALARFKDERAVPLLLSILKESKGKIDDDLLTAIKILKPAEAIPVFADFCRSIDPEMRGIGAEFLGEMRAKEYFETLLQLLRDEYPTVRKASALALGKIADQRATEPLLNALKDSYAIVREAAALALGDIGDKKAIESIASLLSDPNQDVRIASAIALGKLGDARGINQLINILADPPSFKEGKELLEEVCDALAKLGPLASERLLPHSEAEKETWSMSTSSFNIYAGKILGKIGEPRAFEVLLFCLEKLTFSHFDLLTEPFAFETYLNALRNISHQDFGYNLVLWRKWWESNKHLLLKGG